MRATIELIINSTVIKNKVDKKLQLMGLEGKEKYQTKDIQKIFGINRNQLFYWYATKRLIIPESFEIGTGKSTCFSKAELYKLAFIKELLSLGMSLNSIIKYVKNIKFT